MAAGKGGGDDATADPWQVLEPGIELGVFVSPRRSPVGDSTIHVLRVDPARFALALLMAGAETPATNRTARGWADHAGLRAAINSSMFQEDYLTSTELMVSADHVNNPRVTSGKAILAFDRDPAAPAGQPRVHIIDLDRDDLDALRPHYRSLVQSIRMVSWQRENVWSQSKRVWSHACIGIDGEGRPLLIHARSPWTTHDFIDILLELPIDLRQLQYAEGGPEAQLYVNAGGVELERIGSFETGFFESDDNRRGWPVPNVIGVVPRDDAPPDRPDPDGPFLPGDERQPSAPDLTGPHPDRSIAAVLRNAAPRIKVCYEEALRVDPELAVALAPSFDIGPDGHVTEVRRGADASTPTDLAACVDEVIRGLRFLPPEGGGTITVSFPLAGPDPALD